MITEILIKEINDKAFAFVSYVMDTVNSIKRLSTDRLTQTEKHEWESSYIRAVNRVLCFADLDMRLEMAGWRVRQSTREAR